jgi:hypothetical protein
VKNVHDGVYYLHFNSYLDLSLHMVSHFNSYLDLSLHMVSKADTKIVSRSILVADPLFILLDPVIGSGCNS